MKPLILIAMLVSAEANCYKIKDRDAKALCQSQHENKKSCWKIKSRDTKAYCEAVAYGKNSCWKIKNKNMKAMCEASIR